MEAYLGPSHDRPLLALEGLRAGYGHVEALHGVSLTVGEGQIVAIVGPNGAGKTTLMSAVMGLLPRRGGAVRYRARPRERPRRWSPRAPCWCPSNAPCSPT